MKNYILVLLIYPLNCLAQFNSKSDTIIINTIKQIDTKAYLNRTLNIPERSTNCQRLEFPELKGIPDTLDSVSVFITTIDSNQALYQSIKADRIKDKEYIDAVLPKVDTTKCCKKFINTYISVLTGLGKDD